MIHVLSSQAPTVRIHPWAIRKTFRAIAACHYGSQDKGAACRWIWFHAVEWESERKQLLSPRHPCRDPPSSLLSTGKLVSSIHNDRRHKTRGLLCACPRFCFFLYSEKNVPGTPTGGCLPDASITSPETSDRLLIIFSSTANPHVDCCTLSWGEEGGEHILVCVYSLTGHTWLRQEVKMSEEALCRWITDYSGAQMSSWRAAATAAKLPEGSLERSPSVLTAAPNAATDHWLVWVTQSKTGGKCENNMRHAVDKVKRDCFRNIS